MIHSRRLVVGTCAAVMLGAGLLPAMRAEAAPQTLGAVAAASEEPTAVAAGDAAAAATVDLTVDGVTGDICVQSAITGLSGPITMAHIHTGGPGVNGPVFVTLPFTATGVSGCATATPAQAQSILAAPNGFYFNAHTAASPAGAIRGQLSTTLFNASLTGAAEVPGPGDPDGAGSAVVAIDATANRACVLTTVSAIDLPATMAHIHSGAVGVAGPVVVPLTAPATATSASCGTATAAIISAIVASPVGHYVNVHTAAFTGGAIRGPLSLRTASGIPTPSASGSTTAPTSSPTTGATTTSTAPSMTTTTMAAGVSTTKPTTATSAPTTAPAPTPEPATPVVENPTFTG